MIGLQAQAHQQRQHQDAEKQLHKGALKAAEHVAQGRRLAAVDLDKKIKDAADQRPRADKIGEGKKRADEGNAPQAAHRELNEQIDQRGDKQQAHVVLHQLPAPGEAADDVQIVVAFQKVRGRTDGRDGRRRGRRGMRAQRRGEFGELRQRAKVRVAFAFGAGFGIQAAFGDPLQHVG